MGVVEDAFCYRLVWALEAVRMRRVTHGWSPDFIPGGGAACLETGVPQFMMAMLIRAGLPSRQAAMLAVRDGQAQFVDGADMREWLQSKDITEKTKTDTWPSPETAELWKRFRNVSVRASTRLTDLIHSQSDSATPDQEILRLSVFVPLLRTVYCREPVQWGNRDHFSLADFRVLIRTFLVRWWFRFADVV